LCSYYQRIDALALPQPGGALLGRGAERYGAYRFFYPATVRHNSYHALVCQSLELKLPINSVAKLEGRNVTLSHLRSESLTEQGVIANSPPHRNFSVRFSNIALPILKTSDTTRHLPFPYEEMISLASMRAVRGKDAV
jgi:hypothetical protein